MSWQALFQMLIAFFGPVLADLLRGLFSKAAPAGTPDAWEARAGVAKAFAVARAQTWVWELGARAKLRAAERIATTRAPEFYAALRTGAPAPRLTAAERAVVEAA